jgi:hypothetical protein
MAEKFTPQEKQALDLLGDWAPGDCWDCGDRELVVAVGNFHKCKTCVVAHNPMLIEEVLKTA